jgi:hypothetical protein
MKVYVVHWTGDEDCGGRNDGPIAVVTDETEARAIMQREAEAESAKRINGQYDGTVLDWEGGLELHGERCGVYVAEFDLASR